MRLTFKLGKRERDLPKGGEQPSTALRLKGWAQSAAILGHRIRTEPISHINFKLLVIPMALLIKDSLWAAIPVEACARQLAGDLPAHRRGFVLNAAPPPGNQENPTPDQVI